MLTKRFLGLVGVALLIVMFSMSFRPSVTVYADELLQDMPRLDGMNIYFTEAGGEASRFDRSEKGLSRFAGLLSQLGANMFTLEWRTGFPTDADLIIIAGPANDFSANQIARLWAYMDNGGRVLLLADANLEPRRGALYSPNGLFNLMWSDMGLRALDDVIVTEGTEPVYATPMPVGTEEATVEPDAAATEEAPAIVGERPTLISEFTTNNINPTNPITAGLEGDLAFFVARSLEIDASIQGFQVTPLIFTDRNYYGETNFPAYLNNGTFNFNIGNDTTQGELPLAAAFSNDSTQTRVILIGDREFATNGGGLLTSPSNSAGFLYPANAHFLLNAVTWLLEAEPVEMAFPTPAPTATVTITPSPTPTHTPSPEATASS